MLINTSLPAYLKLSPPFLTSDRGNTYATLSFSLFTRYPGRSHFPILKVVLEQYINLIPPDPKTYIIHLLCFEADGLGNGIKQEEDFRELFQVFKTLCQKVELNDIFTVRIYFGMTDIFRPNKQGGYLWPVTEKSENGLGDCVFSDNWSHWTIYHRICGLLLYVLNITAGGII